MKYCAALFFTLAALLAAGPVWAGGSGLNVIVVVNANSAESLQLGNDYCQQRGVPPQNVLRMTNWTGGSVNWSLSQFANDLLDPLLNLVASRGLTNQGEYVVLSMDIPYRVTDSAGNQNSTTAALFYGFKAAGAYGGPNAPPANTVNSYAYSELPFGEAPPDLAPTNAFLAMMLTDTSLAGAESILQRAAASDDTRPTQAVYLEKTPDEARNVRFPEFDNSVFENQVAGNAAVIPIDSGNTYFTNLFGLQTGWAGFTLAANEFAPGAMGDTLTSYGGYILDPTGQTVALAFLEAGAAGSYGTIVEPYNYTQKFPDPVDYFYQWRGFTVAEAYYQSLLNPYEGLMVGEPLAAPFAQPGTATWIAPAGGTALSGTVALSAAFTAAATNLPLTQADLFVDGTFYETLTNAGPAAGNLLTVTLNGDTITCTVETNDTPATIAANLADALNGETNTTEVMAYAVGDRIELQSQALYTPGSNVTLSAGAGLGTGAVLTTGLNAARPAFLDTTATGFLYLGVENPPAVGDWMQLTVLKTNGVSATLAVTNTTAGATIGALLQNLYNQINSTPVLETADGVVGTDYFDLDGLGVPAAQFFLYARTPGLPASLIQATFTTSSDLEPAFSGSSQVTDNWGDLLPRNHLYVSSGLNALTVNAAWDTTKLADGWHQLTAVAYEGTSVRTQTRVSRTVQIQNTPLTATLAVLPPGTNTLLSQQLQFLVTANTTNLSRIELFSTGGSLGAVTNQSAALFTVTATNLGLGLHPFYALVTDQAGHRYQTATVTSFFPVISLTLAGTPPVLAWPAALDHQYDVQFTTSLASGFQTVATLTASNNSTLQWPVPLTSPAGFYRVRLDQ
jgi:uncharacterized protein (TIGR03790 family)